MSEEGGTLNVWTFVLQMKNHCIREGEGIKELWPEAVAFHNMAGRPSMQVADGCLVSTETTTKGDKQDIITSKETSKCKN